MNNALLYLGGLLITALALLFAVPRYVDWNSYRGVFEEEASRILGREVRVGGTVNVRLLPAPYVSFEKLRIADIGDSGGGGHSIIRIESFTMWLSVPPLLRGVLEAHRVELRRPVLHLAVDHNGNGNWRTLALSPGGFPFAPKDVALQSVEIDDGAVVISTAARGELARFDAIKGELNAEALDGPFKFTGNVNWGGTPRKLRVATAKLDANGVLRFKAAVDVVGSTNSYVLDGRFSDLKDSPRLEGDLTARLALNTTATAAAVDAAEADMPAAQPPGEDADLALDADIAAPSAPDEATPEAAAPATATERAAGARGFELKSKLKGTALGVALSDIAISLDAGAAPQLISGEATFDWADKMRLDVALASRWLDLDQIAKGGPERMPLEAARGYFETLASALPAEADTNARLEFDQLTLGGEPISNVRLAASRSGGPLELKGVRADLPGGVRLELDGILTPTAAVPRLDGSLFASGKSLMRFLAWGLGNPEVARERGDGPFSLDGHFALGDGTLALTDAAFSFAGTPLTGDLKLDLGERRKLALAVEGPRIDAAQIGSGVVSLRSLRDVLFGDGTAAADTGGGADGDTGHDGGGESAGFDPAGADLALDLKVAELVDGDRVLNDVDLVVQLERGMLSIPRLKFSTPEGLSVEAEGEAADVPTRPKGTLRGLVSAPNPKAARALLALIGDDDGTQAADLDRLARLAPLRLDGTLKLTGGANNASALAVDGTLGGGRLTAQLRLDGGRSQWRTRPLDIQVTAESPDVAQLVATLFDARFKAEAEEPTPGRAVLKATGVPAEGLLALADVTAEGLALGYRGEVRLPAPGETGFEGDLQIAAEDARVALALAGVATGDGAAQIPIGGSVHVTREGGVLRAEGNALRVGASIVSGHMSLTAEENGRQIIDASLKANKASFAGLLAPLLGRASGLPDLDDLAAAAPAPAPQPARGKATAAPEEQEAVAVIWPDQAFDLGPLSRLGGKIDIAIGTLAVEPGLSIGNARIEALLSPEAVKVTRFDGDAVGGRLTSTLDLERAPAGIGLKGTLRIDVASTPVPAESASEAPEGPPPPGDAAAFAVEFSSRALSPAAVVSALTGKGELTVGDATLNGNSPVAVSAVAQAALTGQGPSSGAGLTDALRDSLGQGELRLGKITIPVKISDGALQLERVRIDMKEGRSTFVTAVELATMKIDSEWQIEPKLDTAFGASASRALLPPVTVVYTGKLSQFAELVPAVSAGALERELVVRKMELDVGELERLRKLDEERARKDAERRRVLEEERARAEAARARAEAERRRALEDDEAPASEAGPDGVLRENLSVPLPDAGQVEDGAAGQQAGTAAGSEAGNLEASEAAPQVVPSPASQRPRRKRPPSEEWRPFQITPY